MIELKDADILLRLTNFEDAFVERKTSGDSSDWLSAALAFANSAPIDYPAILFVGVKDDGTIENTVNLDSLQKTLNKKLASAYPPLYYLPRVLEQAGKQFLAVIIPGSAHRPHFAGQAYVRVGTEAKAASEEQFARLVAERNSKAYEILKWRGKKVTLRFPHVAMASKSLLEPGYTSEAIITDCNQFYVTLESIGFIATDIYKKAVPLGALEISFDHKEGRLELRVSQG